MFEYVQCCCLVICQVVQVVLVFQCSADNSWAPFVHVVQVVQHVAKTIGASCFQVLQVFQHVAWVPIFCVICLNTKKHDAQRFSAEHWTTRTT